MPGNPKGVVCFIWKSKGGLISSTGGIQFFFWKIPFTYLHTVCELSSRHVKHTTTNPQQASTCFATGMRTSISKAGESSVENESIEK